ncbi:MAG: thioredoxin [Anaerolineaceae bacterium]|nr:thioredoxin [Anaerolineaceae bacterium]
MSDKTFEVTEANFQKEVLESTEPVLIDFWAEWCTPCKMIGPLVEQIADEYKGKVRVGKLDADANPDVLMRYNVMGIPTLMLFKGGEAVERITGYQPKDKITAKLVPHIS